MARKIKKINRRTSRSLSRAMKMIAGRKIIIHVEELALIDVTVNDICNSKGKRLEFYVDDETHDLLVFVSKDGCPITGKRDNPEIYCAEVCKEILDVLGRTLTGAGTVKFPDITVDTIDGSDAKCLVVNLSEYCANPGVFTTTSEEQDVALTERDRKSVV